MKKLLLALVGSFLLVFMLLPMVSLVLVSFVGEPVALLDPAGTLSQLANKASLSHYLEFLTTRRYRSGMLNSLGFAPLCAVAAWLILRLGGSLLGRPVKGRRLALAMAVAFGAALLFAAVWPWLMPARHPDGSESLGRMLAPGKLLWVRLLRSLGYCPLVTLAATILGVGVAFCLTRTSMPGRGWIRIFCIFPLALPSFLGALAFKNLLGEHGMVTNVLGLHLFEAQSPLSAGFVQAFLFFPLVVLTTAAALDRTDPSLGEAAGVMGATRNFTFWTVSLPVILPGIAAGAFLVFIRSFGDYAALSLLLPIQYPVIVCEAYKDLSGSTNWGGASMLSTLMIITVLTLLALQKQFVESGTFQTVTGRAGGQDRPSDGPLARYGALAFVTAVFSVPLSFLASTLLVSFARNWGAEPLPPAYTLSRYTRAFATLFEENSPLFNSFALVLPALLGATVLSFLIAWLIARSNRTTGQLLDFATMLPFVVPGVAFAVALIGAFNRPPLVLHFTVTLVVIAYIVTRVPYGVRSTLASFQQIGGSMEESSKTMGATQDLTLAKVTIPLVLPGVLAGAIMVFISAMEDVSITLMCCPPRWYPASIYVFHEINKGALFEASAYGVILLGLVLVPYLVAHKLGARD